MPPSLFKISRYATACRRVDLFFCISPIDIIEVSNKLFWVIEDQSHQKWAMKKIRLVTTELRTSEVNLMLFRPLRTLLMSRAGERGVQSIGARHVFRGPAVIKFFIRDTRAEMLEKLRIRYVKTNQCAK